MDDDDEFKDKPPLDPKHLYSSAEAAAWIGCSQRSVQRRAESEGIGKRVGKSFSFTPAQLKKLAKTIRRGPGNPNAGEAIGNNGGGKPRRAE